MTLFKFCCGKSTTWIPTILAAVPFFNNRELHFLFRKNTSSNEISFVGLQIRGLCAGVNFCVVWYQLVSLFSRWIWWQACLQRSLSLAGRIIFLQDYKWWVATYCVGLDCQVWNFLTPLTHRHINLFSLKNQNFVIQKYLATFKKPS